MDASLFLISASHVSAGRFAGLAKRLEAASPQIALAVRLDGDGRGLWAALDALTERGATRIDLRPVGLPFSQSLEAWLPGAAGSWLARRGGGAPALYFGAAPDGDHRVVSAAARADIPFRRIGAAPAGHKGAGWDTPPPARHHLLVCAGPRCHLLDAPSLAGVLKREIARAGLDRECLVTTTGCLFPCNRGPALVHYPQGNWYRLPDADAVRRFVREALSAGGVPGDLHFHTTGATHEVL